MQKNAPYANTAIILSLGSVTGLKYRTINCIECGNPIIERSGDSFSRLTGNMPENAHISADGTIKSICNKCLQKYTIVLSQSVQSIKYDSIPLYMQPESIFMEVEPSKRLRDVYCMECGKAFFSVSDRIKMISDNTIPFSILDPDKLGSMEVWCKFHHCKQRWSVMT